MNETKNYCAELLTRFKKEKISFHFLVKHDILQFRFKEYCSTIMLHMTDVRYFYLIFMVRFSTIHFVGTLWSSKKIDVYFCYIVCSLFTE